MHGKKIIKYLERLPPEEYDKFRDFINSPYFNKERNLLDFFNYLINFSPDFESKKLVKEKVAEKLFPMKSLDSSLNKLSKKQTALVKLLEKYFSFKKIDQSKILKEKMEIDFLYHFDYEKFRGKVLEINSDFRYRQYLSIEELDHLTDINWSLFYHPQTNRHQFNNLHQILEFKEKAFALLKFRLITELLLRKNLLPDKIEIPSSNDLKQYCKKYDYPILHIYNSLKKLLESKTPSDNFDETLNELNNYAEEISYFDRQNVLSKLSNLAYHYYERKNLKYLDKLFNIYKIAEKLDLLTYNNMINEMTFLNVAIATSAAEMNKTSNVQWAKQFIANYSKFLPPNSQGDTIDLANSYILFWEKRHQDVLDKLNIIKREHTAFHIQIETLYLRTYYELFIKGALPVNTLISHITKFKKYLERKDTPAANKREAIKSFVHLIKLMIEQRENPVKNIRPRIKDFYNDKKAVFGGFWIKNKILQV